MNLQQTCAMAVMAKAPVPGHVKTRLQPVLSPSEAAALGGAFLTDITHNLQQASRVVPIHGFVAYAPSGQESRFDGLLAPGTRLVLADGSTDAATGVEGLGRSLLHATRALLQLGYGAACLINADSPTVPTEFLIRAAERLAAPGERAVIGRADDGGYWLIGMKRAYPELYAEIPWSTGHVAAVTAARAASIGLSLEDIGTWFDVDDRNSLARLVDQLETPADENRFFRAPATSRAMRALDVASRLRPAA